MDTIKERFIKFVLIDPVSGCWNWIGTKKNRGYGGFRYNGKFTKAHRVSWQLYKGAIPEGMCICHHCDNESCVCPDHLFSGTHTDNMRDKSEKGRSNPCRGDKARWRKLNSSDVIQIRSMYKTGEYTQRGLAKMFKVSQSTILFLLQGRNWASIPQENSI